MLLKSVVLGLLASFGLAASVSNNAASLHKRADSADRLVFAHFMIGIVGSRSSAADYDDDMRRAKDAGIDAFALNIGTDTYADVQLDYAYESAQNNGMKVFISFDFNYYNAGQGSDVGSKIAKYASRPAQLKIGDRVFASTFNGDGVNVNTIKSAAGSNVFFVPNFHPWASTSNDIDGGFNWMGWPNDGNNKAPKNGKSVSVLDGDNSYKSWLNGKPYMAPVSPWFFTHYGPEVKYSKNWVFPSGSLIFDRWNEILKYGYNMVEIVTWNDYGESYMGPLSSRHNDDGASKWVNDMPHIGWLELSKPYIAAYKNRATSVNNYITKDQVVYWYRRTLKNLDCDATDTTANRPVDNNDGNYFMGRPDGWESMDDTVYVVALLTQPGRIIASSGANTVTKDVPAGATLIEVPAALGKQKFTLSRNDKVVMEDTSKMEISNVCPCGLYNFNAYVGTVPAGQNDALGAEGLASLTVGLHVSTCLPQPSLGTNPPSPTDGCGDPPTPTGTCNGGTNAPGQSENLSGLCKYTCGYGYCPPGPCKCTSYGTPATPPATIGRDGCPADGLGDAYKGLCSYTCSRNYCPEGACKWC